MVSIGFIGAVSITLVDTEIWLGGTKVWTVQSQARVSKIAAIQTVCESVEVQMKEKYLPVSGVLH